MRNNWSRPICLILCTMMMITGSGIASYGENAQTKIITNDFMNENERASEFGQDELNKLQIDEFLSNLQECYDKYSFFMNDTIVDWVIPYLLINYSYCDAALINQLNERGLLILDDKHPLEQLYQQDPIPTFMFYITENQGSDLSRLFYNPNDYTFFMNLIEDFIAFTKQDKKKADIKPFVSFVKKYEHICQETQKENKGTWFTLVLVGNFFLNYVHQFGGMIDHMNGLLSIQKLEKYIDINKSVDYKYKLKEGVVLDIDSEDNYIAYLAGTALIAQIIDQFEEKTIYSYEQELRSGLQAIQKEMPSSAQPFTNKESVFYGVQFDQIMAEGFQIPIPSGFLWEIDTSDYYVGFIYSAYANTVNSEYNPLIITAYYNEPDTQSHFAEDPDVARAVIEKELSNTTHSNTDVHQKIIDLDGHPAGLITYTRKQNGDTYYWGDIIYIRNNRCLRISAYIPEYYYTNDRVTLDDLKVLSDMLLYDESQAPFTAAKATFTISTKDDVNVVSAGKNLQMSAVFDNPEIINKKAKNDGVTWSVFNAQTDDIIPLATINSNGQLRIDKNLDAPIQLLVKATSTAFGTEASYMITAMPVVSAVTLDPAQLFFYVGMEDPQTVKASLEPASVPPVGLTWTPAKKDIVEITAIEDGTVSIKPLKAGKTDIAVKEPGGKNAKLPVNVVAPGESVELTVNGKPKAGGKVTIAAALMPKNVGNKAVQWNLDVGEDIATINEKGQLTIGKEVASGTKITVTCTALGAPNPVVGTIVVEVP